MILGLWLLINFLCDFILIRKGGYITKVPLRKSCKLHPYREEDCADTEEAADSFMEALAAGLPSDESVSIHPSAREVA